MQVLAYLKNQLLEPVGAHDRMGQTWARLVGAITLAASMAATALFAWFLYRVPHYDPFGIVFLLTVALTTTAGLVIGLRLLRGHRTELLPSWALVALGLFFLACPIALIYLAAGRFLEHPLQVAVGSLAAVFLSGLCFLAVRSRRGV